MSLPGFTAEVGLGQRATLLAPAARSDHLPTGELIIPQLGLLNYGKYCGPGHGDRTYRARPVDAVDAVCKTHDQCWDARGNLDCRCDRKLIVGMHAAVVSPGVSALGRAYGAAAIAYFKRAPCVCRKKICYHVPVCNWRGCRMRRRCNTIMVPGFGGIGPC